MKSLAIILTFILVVYQVDASEEEEEGDINIVIEQHVKIPGPPDVDECFEDIDTCADNEVCVNNPGSYTCICADGYEKVEGTCEDVDECSKDVAVCGDFSECINIVGSFSCKCNEGFEDVEGFCEDIDECSANENPCWDNSECVNILGNFTCNCNEGFEEVDDICIDVDECSKDVAVCDDFSECVNIVGSFSCKCTEGFEDVEGFCEDIDECSVNENLCDYDNRECVNILGNFICNCKEGFEEVDNICKDIDECNADNILCGDNEVCRNSIGSYTCICESGYADIGSGCESCIMTYTADNLDTFEWSTPNYPDNYPEDIVCGLNVTISETFADSYGIPTMYAVTWTVMEPGKIHDSSNNNDCTMSSDHLTVYDDAATKVIELCGDVETSVSWKTDNKKDVTKLITLLFQSNSEDGASAKGIKVLITVTTQGL